MNETNPTPEAQAPSQPQSLAPSTPSSLEPQEAIRALQRQISTLLILLLVVSGTFTVYLYQKVRHARKDLVALRPQAQQIIADYQQRGEPVMRDFLTKLQAFAGENPDILPYLQKYGLAERSATVPSNPEPGGANETLPPVPLE